MKRNFLFSALLILLIGFIPGNQTDSLLRRMKWVVIPGCSLRVQGSTNVNKFSCELIDYGKPDTLIVSQNKGQNGVFPVSGTLSLDVSGFDCHQKIMTADLRKTMKEKEYPKLNIRFRTFNRQPVLNAETDHISGLIDIEIAGVSRRFEVCYTVFMDENKIINLAGRHNLSFSDFNLARPHKFGGIIRTDDRLLIDFNLRMKMIK